VGFYIAIEGVDGVGKTTQISNLSVEFQKQAVALKVIRFQRFLSAPFARAAKKKGIALRQVSAPPLISFLESIDEVFTYWLLVYPQLAVGKNVVRDRCGLTRLVNANVFNTSRLLVASILRLCPAPQKIFVLSVPPEIAAQRAAEKSNRSLDDTDAYINAAIKEYTKTTRDTRNAIAIDGLRHPQEISREIMVVLGTSNAGLR
jgi:thymidylate kinase